jgi:alkaline phosphatase
MNFRLLCGAAALALGIAAAPVAAQTIYPIDRASILAGSKFDVKVEFPAMIINAVGMRVTLNGQDILQTGNGNPTFIQAEDGKLVSSLIVRDMSLSTPGSYTLQASDGTNTKSVTWEVYATPANPVAKNVILFIGDGMSVAHVTAARILSRQVVEGKYKSKLTIDSFPQMATIGTSGVDSVITDSANSAHAYTTGHKSTTNALGVYVSRAAVNTAHPRVETLAEIVKRKTSKSVGVVTNTEIEDATPASMTSHTRSRSDYDIIVEQQYNVRPDVILGGGAANFLPKSAPGSRRADDQDFIAKYRAAGYPVATTVGEMQAAAANAGNTKLLGLFHLSNMDGVLDRKFLKANTVKTYPQQPDLTEQVKAAIDVLSRNPNGFVLMVESGLIDKFSHPLDWERAVYDTIMLDNAVKVAVDYAGNRNDTLIMVMPDHTHGINIVGTVDDARAGDQMRDKIGVYQDAGYPNYPAPNAENYPEKVDVTKRLAVFFNNFPDYYETFRPKLDATFNPAVQDPVSKVYVANQKYKDVPGAMLRTGNLPRATGSTGVHTADDGIARGFGPGSDQLKGFVENTEIFRIMANALALGR